MLNYGIILTHAALKNWHVRCIERLHQSKLAQLRLVLNDVGGAPPAGEPPLYSTVPSEKNADVADIFKIVPAAARIDLRLDKPRRDGYRFDVDFFLLFGDERSGAPLVHATPFGVWYFSYGDLPRFYSTAPAFWEVHGDHDVTGAFLLRMSDDGSAGVPLKCGFLPTQRRSFEANLEALRVAIVKWPQHVCWDITQDAAEYFQAPPLAKPSRWYGQPSPVEIARMRLRQGRRRAAGFVREKFFATEWTVVRVQESPADFIGSERRARVTPLYPSSRNGFLADPCVVQRGSHAYVFCEQFRRKTNLGSVAVLRIGDDGVKTPEAAIEETHHLSYPHVFEHDGQTYCIPESGGIRKVCLYRCVEFPHKWQFVHTLIDGFEAADSTILYHKGRWWLFCTSSEDTPKGYYSHLYIWHANDLFGTWTQHVHNPVKIDARSSRPAGPFFTHEDVLYRPAQDCSRSYGSAVRINRIEALSTTAFAETVVGTIRPPRRGYAHGLHTLSAAGQWCIVDVERYVFSPSNARYAFTQVLQHALLRVGISEDAIAWIKRKVKSTEATDVRAAQPSKSE